MKCIVGTALILTLFSAGIIGCADKSSKKTETEITTPGGKTTITTETDVKKTGENPPAARP